MATSTTNSRLQAYNPSTRKYEQLHCEGGRILVKDAGTSTELPITESILDLYLDGAVVQADSANSFFRPANGEDGWEYMNTMVGASNAYFYSSSLQGEPTLTVSNLDGQFFVCQVKSVASLPFIAYHTKPVSGSTGWYQTRRVFIAPAGTYLNSGQQVLLYWGKEPSASVFPNTPRVLLEVDGVSTQGPNSGTEDVNTAATSLSQRYILQAAGFIAHGQQRMFRFSHKSKQVNGELNLAALSVSGGKLSVDAGTMTINNSSSSVLIYGYDSTLASNKVISTTSSGAVQTSVLNAVSVFNTPGNELVVKKSAPTVMTLHSGSVSANSYYGNLDVLQYNSADVLVSVPANALSSGGSLYVGVSDNAVDWYKLTNYSTYLTTSSTAATYGMSLSAINTRYMCIFTDSYNGPTTNSEQIITVKVSLKL
jgi:hypothetical protein